MHLRLCTDEDAQERKKKKDEVTGSPGEARLSAEGGI